MKTIMEKITDRYLLSYRKNNRTGENELILTSKSKGKHRAVHTRYNVVDENGRVLKTLPIDDEAAHIIFKHFESLGDTESFNISKVDYEDFGDLSFNKDKVDPENVIHSITTAEKSYTATGDKLDFHWPIFDKYSQTGYGSIIRATMTNHQVCSSACQYCSTISRNKKDSVSLEEAMDFVNKLYFDQGNFNRKNYSVYNKQYKQLTGTDIRLKGLILSGGGQPNLWPYFSEFIEWVSDLDIDLGLITNGFPKTVSNEIYEAFKWIRISITPEDASPFYPDGRFDKQYIPPHLINNPNITVGFSYVYGPWSTDDIFKRIDRSVSENKFDYARVLTDCNLTRSSQLRSHESLSSVLRRLGFTGDDGVPTGKIFHQLKYHGTKKEADNLWNDGQCLLQTYNVFWDTTGHEEQGFSYCYPCDSVTVLAEEATENHISASERRFVPHKWGTFKNTEVEKLYREPVKSFFDPRDLCSSCLFMKNNGKVRESINQNQIKDISPALNSDISHVNFP